MEHDLGGKIFCIKSNKNETSPKSRYRQRGLSDQLKIFSNVFTSNSKMIKKTLLFHKLPCAAITKTHC